MVQFSTICMVLVISKVLDLNTKQAYYTNAFTQALLNYYEVFYIKVTHDLYIK